MCQASSGAIGQGIIYAKGMWRAEEGKPLAEAALVMSFVSIAAYLNQEAANTAAALYC